MEDNKPTLPKGYALPKKVGDEPKVSLMLVRDGSVYAVEFINPIKQASIEAYASINKITKVYYDLDHFPVFIRYHDEKNNLLFIDTRTEFDHGFKLKGCS